MLTCLGTRAYVGAFAAAGHTASELLVAGGATRSETWLQVIFFNFFTGRVIGEVSSIKLKISEFKV
jgi:ribulose kinase